MDVVEECTESFNADPHPFKQGNVMCLWYNKDTHQPRIVIGPDYLLCLLKLFLMNSCSLALIFSCWLVGRPKLFYVMIGTTFFENLAFGVTMFKNQGLCPRDPAVHSLAYLNKVKTV